MRFGQSGNLAGATLAAFDREVAQKLLLGGKGYSTIAIAAEEGVTQAELRDRVAAVVPAGLEAKTGEELAKDQQSDIEQGLRFINTFLLVFPAGLRVDRGLRRRIHHPQHLLDTRRPAHSRDGVAAHRGREPPAGLPVGHARSARRRHRRLHARHRRRTGAGARAPGDPEVHRPGRPDRRLGHRSRHNRVWLRRRHRRDAGVGVVPSAPRGEGRPGRGPARRHRHPRALPAPACARRRRSRRSVGGGPWSAAWPATAAGAPCWSASPRCWSWSA